MKPHHAMRSRTLSCLGLFAMLLAQAWPAAAADPVLGDAQTLLQQGKANDAYGLLATKESELAGEIDFDYLLGVAALDAGKPAQASLAFERVLATNPNHAGARLDLARAYYAMGDLPRARLEFQTVLAQNPPAPAKRTVEQHLEAIARQEQQFKGAWSGYIEANTGYDDNLTSVTSDFTQAILSTYQLPNIQPTGNAIKREDFFYGLAGNAEYRQKINPQDAWFAGAEARYRHYFRQHSYDSTTAMAYAGFERTLEQDILRGTANAQETWQEGETPGTPTPQLDRRIQGINGEWRHSLNPQNQTALFAQYNRLRYPDMPSSDVNQLTLGGAWMHLFNAPSQPMGALILLRSEEDAQEQLPNGSDYSKRITGLRLAGQFNLQRDLVAFGNLGVQWRNDAKQSARLNGITGKDKLWEATLGASWQLDQEWSLKPQLYLARNTSNIPLYEYKRSEFTLSLRKDFR